MTKSPSRRSRKPRSHRHSPPRYSHGTHTRLSKPKPTPQTRTRSCSTSSKRRASVGSSSSFPSASGRRSPTEAGRRTCARSTATQCVHCRRRLRVGRSHCRCMRDGALKYKPRVDFWKAKVVWVDWTCLVRAWNLVVDGILEKYNL